MVWRWSKRRFSVSLRRFHLPSSRGTQSQTVHAERRIIPSSTGIHWRCQNYLHYVHRVMDKQEEISGPCLEISFTAITLNQESNSTCRERESFPIPLRYIDVSTGTNTTLDVLLERRIDDYWNIEGDPDLSDAWTGFTQFTMLYENFPDGSSWFGERLTQRQKKKNIQVGSLVARNME